MESLKALDIEEKPEDALVPGPALLEKGAFD